MMDSTTQQATTIIDELLTTTTLSSLTSESFKPTTMNSEVKTTSWLADISTASTTKDIILTSPELKESNASDYLSRMRRAIQFDDILEPGACLQGCKTAFWTFSIASMIINWVGSSGRIGNLLVNYRSVSTEDKSFAQGLSLMLVSLFALIPGPIIFGRIIDSTCLKWTQTCSGNGNCQLYDQASFRYLVNSFAVCK